MEVTVNQNYLYRGEKPFFLLADTAWLLFEKLNDEEIERYFKNRSLLGYNAIFAVAVHGDGDEETLNPCVNSLSYWNRISAIVDLAQKYDLIVGLLPAWGALVKNGVIHEGNLERYARFLGQFFQKKRNLIWVLGGDVRGDCNFALFDQWGKLLKEYNPERLITFHPFGRTGSYEWFSRCKWLDFHCFQSGHRRYDQFLVNPWDVMPNKEDWFGEDNWRYVVKSNSYPEQKPCMDGEPSYEGIVQGLHDPTQPYWEARDVRRYAYWSVFEGACGFTYGHNAVMQFHREGEKGSFGVRETWQEGLHACGGAQMRYLKELMESVNFPSGKPHPEYVLNQGERHHRTSVFAGEDFIFFYNYCGDEMTIDCREYGKREFKAYWMNPENGGKSYIGAFRAGNVLSFRPTARRELSNDWVLIFEFAPEKAAE